ncbi:hypothetical protein MTR_1g050508 [Medicago truncatula]|uniref:Uncharacterized protein n=1 Tax=Medicago truncatula TaxID=3880 RepID=A0A072VHD9_MEDTR|nr:hypothetical protein MTR_1g050508 [Medicago truncatula]
MSCIFIFVWRSLGGFDMVDLGSEKKQNSLRHFSSPFTLQLNYHKPYDVYNQPMESIAQRIHKLHEYKTSKFFVQKKTKLILLAKYWQRILGRKVIFPSLWTEQKVSNLNIALIVNKNFLRFQRRGEE